MDSKVFRGTFKASLGQAMSPMHHTDPGPTQQVLTKPLPEEPHKDNTTWGILGMTCKQCSGL